MSNINKEMLIHIGAEIIIIGGVAFYFYKQNKKLAERITELESTVNEFQEQSMKQQKQLNLINKRLNSLNTQPPTRKTTTTPLENRANTQPTSDNVKSQATIVNKQPDIVIDDTPSDMRLLNMNVDELDSDNESLGDNNDFITDELSEDDLDDQLREELKDLD